MKLIKTAGYEKLSQGFGALEGGLPSEPQMGHSELAEAMDGLASAVDFALRSPPEELQEALASMDINGLKQKLTQLMSKMQEPTPGPLGLHQ